jgi:hypothetical protein
MYGGRVWQTILSIAFHAPSSPASSGPRSRRLGLQIQSKLNLTLESSARLGCKLPVPTHTPASRVAIGTIICQRSSMRRAKTEFDPTNVSDPKIVQHLLFLQIQPRGPSKQRASVAECEGVLRVVHLSCLCPDF